MKYIPFFGFICMVYASYLRPLVKEKVDDPNSDHDELLMDVLDKIFNYHV